MTLRPPLPGRYLDVPYATYAAWGHLRQSHLHPLLEGQSPAHYWYYRQHPKASTEAMQLGSALDCALLDPDALPGAVVRAPDRPRRSRVDRAWWAQWAADHPGVVALSEDAWERLQGMLAAVHAHRGARLLLEQPDAHRQPSYVYDHALILEDGTPWTLRLQGRPDWELPDEGLMVDLKTCRSAAWRRFRCEVTDRWYHGQAGAYRQMAAAAGWRPERYLYLCVENEPPYGVAVRPLSEARWTEGWVGVAAALATVAACERAGSYPGYPDTLDDTDPV